MGLAVFLLLAMGFSGTVYAKGPEKLDTVEKVENRINKDFMKWYRRNAERLPELSEKNINRIFRQFLEENPHEKIYLKILTAMEKKKIQRKESTENKAMIEKAKNIPLIVNEGKCVKRKVSYSKTTEGTFKIVNSLYVLKINGEIYKVWKTSIYTPEGVEIVDPYVWVHIHYFTTQIAWWTVTYGEVDFIYQEFLYDTYPLNHRHYDEAYAFKDKFDKLAPGSSVYGVIFGAILSAIGMAVGSVFLGLDVAELVYAQQKINDAYYKDESMGYMLICTQNDYFYPQTVVGNLADGWGIKVYISNVGWVDALYPLVLSGVVSWHISDISHKIVNTYGDNNIVWMGVYK